jgi:hypothetical protein
MMITSEQNIMANRCARAAGTNRATKIILRSDILQAKVIKLDHYHAESRTGIRAGMAALKRYWHTYHYVPTVCVVAVPDADSIYNSDDH